MQLIKWNPINDMMTMGNHMGRLFDEFFYPANGHTAWENEGWNPVADVLENEAAYIVKAELPGLDKKQISVAVKAGVLTIKGERSDEKEVKTDKVYRRERFQGRFHRAFVLPPTVEADKIEAEFTDGLLKITIPKTVKEKPKQITVH